MQYYKYLKTLKYRYDNKRGEGYFGEPYQYGNNKFEKKKFPFKLELIKNQIEGMFNTEFDMCLINWYNSEGNRIGFHKDAEEQIKPNSMIVCLSFGADAELGVKSDGIVDWVYIKKNSLYVMPENFQKIIFIRYMLLLVGYP